MNTFNNLENLRKQSLSPLELAHLMGSIADAWSGAGSAEISGSHTENYDTGAVIDRRHVRGNVTHVQGPCCFAGGLIVRREVDFLSKDSVNGVVTTDRVILRTLSYDEQGNHPHVTAEEFGSSIDLGNPSWAILIEQLGGFPEE